MRARALLARSGPALLECYGELRDLLQRHAHADRSTHEQLLEVFSGDGASAGAPGGGGCGRGWFWRCGITVGHTRM